MKLTGRPIAAHSTLREPLDGRSTPSENPHLFWNAGAIGCVVELGLIEWFKIARAADLKNKRWDTESRGKTDAQGALSLRGFLGQYQVSVTHEGKTKTAEATLDAKGSTVRVKLDG